MQNRPSASRSPLSRRRRSPRTALASSTLASVAALAMLMLGGAAADATSHAVGIVDVGPYDSAFSPGSITIQAGDRVTWTNKSTAVHNVVFSSFGSNDLDPGSTYQHTFAVAGTFRYSCTIHGFTGRVVVTGSTATPKPTPKPTPRATPRPTAKPTARPVSTAKPVTTVVPAVTPAPTRTPTLSGVPSTPPASPAATTYPGPSLALAGPPGSVAPSSPTGPPDGGAATASTGTPVLFLAAVLVVLAGLGGAVLARRRG